jgi:hypothetical protein
VIESEGMLHLSKAQWSGLTNLGLRRKILTEIIIELELRVFDGWFGQTGRRLILLIWVGLVKLRSKQIQ